MSGDTLAATVATEMNNFDGLKASLHHSAGVPAVFRVLRQYLGEPTDYEPFRTVFYDFSKRAGGDGMTGGPLNKMNAALVNGDEMPFISVSISDNETRAKLIVLKEYYQDELQVEMSGNRAYLTVNKSFF